MHSSTTVLGVEWSASQPGRFTPRERAPGTHWIGNCEDELHSEVYKRMPETCEL